jgi:hypothetical protein
VPSPDPAAGPGDGDPAQTDDVDPDADSDGIDEDVIHDAVIELNELRIAMAMDPIDHPSAGDQPPSD